MTLAAASPVASRSCGWDRLPAPRYVTGVQTADRTEGLAEMRTHVRAGGWLGGPSLEAPLLGFSQHWK